MTQENKELLLKELCARLPYGICVNLPNHHLVSHKYVIYDINIKNGWTTGLLDCAGRIQIYGAKVEDIKPYLRPMASMTEEEENEYNIAIDKDIEPERIVDWLNARHLDYRGLIPMDLAIEVTKENNPYL